MKMKEEYMKQIEEENFLKQSRNLDLMAKTIFSNNFEKGFWDICKYEIDYVDENGELRTELDFRPDLRNVGECLMLMTTELAEALEAHRDNINDKHLPEYKGLHVELADTIVRILDFCGAHDIPIGEIVAKKVQYNKNRPHKHGRNF